MQPISPVDCADWLNIRNLPAFPYGKAAVHGFAYAQFPMPESSATIHKILEEAGGVTGGLLVFTDWYFYHPEDWQQYKDHQLELVKVIEDYAVKANDLEKGVSFVYGAEEKEALFQHVQAGVELGWSVYFYSAATSTILYFWEGDLLDVWTTSASLLQEIPQHLAA